MEATIHEAESEIGQKVYASAERISVGPKVVTRLQVVPVPVIIAVFTVWNNTI